MLREALEQAVEGLPLMLVELTNSRAFPPQPFSVHPENVIHLIDTQALSVDHVFGLRVATDLNLLVHRLVHLKFLRKLLYARIQGARCHAQRDT